MKTQNAIFGRSRKSFGSATAYTMNGQNIVRTKPIAVANPRTIAQILQRVRFNAFTTAANGVSEADLKILFEKKQVGRNRRTTLQAQLAPAYGAQANSDPTAAERIIPTFDYTKLSALGTGEVGFVGDFIQGTYGDNVLRLTHGRLETMKESMVLDGSETHIFVVAISEDGCIMKVSTPITMEEVNNAIESGITLNIDEMGELAGHGNKAWCYAFGAVISAERGFGSFIIKKRPQKTGRDQHNTPVR